MTEIAQTVIFETEGGLIPAQESRLDNDIITGFAHGVADKSVIGVVSAIVIGIWVAIVPDSVVV